LVAGHGLMRVPAGEQRAAERTAKRAAGHGGGGGESLTGEPVEVWRVQVRVAHRAEGVEAVLVADDPQEIGPGSRGSLMPALLRQRSVR